MSRGLLQTFTVKPAWQLLALFIILLNPSMIDSESSSTMPAPEPASPTHRYSKHIIVLLSSFCPYKKVKTLTATS